MAQNYHTIMTANKESSSGGKPEGSSTEHKTLRRQQSFSQRLSHAFESGKDAGEKLGNVASEIADSAAEWINNNPKKVKAIAAITATVVGAFTSGIGGIAAAAALAVAEEAIAKLASNRVDTIQKRENALQEREKNGVDGKGKELESLSPADQVTQMLKNISDKMSEMEKDSAVSKEHLDAIRKNLGSMQQASQSWSERAEATKPKGEEFGGR